MNEEKAKAIKKRFKEFREQLGKTQAELANDINVDKSSISKIESFKELKRLPTPNIVMEMAAVYGLDRKWLETGVKKPRLEATPLHLASDPHDYDNDGSKFEELPDGTLRMRVPIIPIKAYAGYLVGFQDPEFYGDLETISIDVFKQHRGHYLAFEVKGESMTTLEPEHFKKSIFEGSIAIGRELQRHLWRYKLHTHNYDAWVIVHKTEGILIKQIIKHDVENGRITIHSLNPDKEKYPDEELFLDDIEQIFNIIQIVNKR